MTWPARTDEAEKRTRPAQSIDITDESENLEMLDMLRKRRDDEEGFTLIELMVVVLIIAILLAIAIPTFLGARERANDRAAQSSLRNALTAAKTLFTDSQDYSVATAGSLPAIEPSLSYVAGTAPSTDFKVVSVSPTSATVWTAAALSKSGKCFVIMDTTTVGGGTWYNQAAGTATTCMPSLAVPTASTSW